MYYILYEGRPKVNKKIILKKLLTTNLLYVIIILLTKSLLDDEEVKRMGRFGMMIDDELLKKAKIKCIENGKSLKEYVATLIQKDIEKEKE